MVPVGLAGAAEVGAGAETAVVSTDWVNGAGPESPGDCSATSLAAGMASLAGPPPLLLLTISTVATTATTAVPATTASFLPERHHGVGRPPDGPPGAPPEEPPDEPPGPEGPDGGTDGGPGGPLDGGPESGPDGGPDGGPNGGPEGGWELIEAPFRGRPAKRPAQMAPATGFHFCPRRASAATARRRRVAVRTQRAPPRPG